MRIRALSFVAALALLIIILAGAASGDSLSIRSSLDGDKVLPHRIHWLGFPSVPAGQVNEVDFLVDGRRVWIEHHPPFTYGLDGNWFVTSWLKPGMHHFTVTLSTKRGLRASDTVSARSLVPQQPPSALTGRWKRTVTKAEAGTGTPAGTWTLKIDQTGWKLRDPLGGRNWVDVAYLGASRFQARGGIWTTPVHSQGGNGWCEDTNVPVDYAWNLSGVTLTVTLTGVDRCGPRNAKQHFIWAGEWTHAA